MKTKDPTASCDLTIKFYCLECVGAYFAEAVNSADELIASTHLWESKTDVWRELATLLSQCEAVTA